MAVQYASKGIRCNCICPGTIDSPWLGRLLDQAADPAEARAALVARQPSGRLGDPAEVAAAALYLASPEAAFCTGTALVIDGGIVAASVSEDVGSAGRANARRGLVQVVEDRVRVISRSTVSVNRGLVAIG